MNFNAVVLELFTAFLGITLLFITLIIPRRFIKIPGILAVVGLTAILVSSFFITPGNDMVFINGLFYLDSYALLFKQIFLVAGILITMISIGYIENLPCNHGEFFSMLVFAVFGMMTMVSANDFLTLYIGLEMMTITFIVLTSIKKLDLRSSEAGMKYIFLNAMSSAVLLYGISIVYGVSGSFLFTDIINTLSKPDMGPAIRIAVIFIIAAFAFKISAVPFHMWSPDIYEGAPAPVTAFLATGSKAAAFAVIIRVFYQALPDMGNIIVIIVLGLSCLSMAIGNLVAIPQTNIKRLLAYSSIAQAGYMLTGIVAGQVDGINAVLFYIILYLFANTGIFAAVVAVTLEAGNDDIQSFSGLWRRSPLITGVILISLISMAGIPPAAGFIGKFMLFSAAVKQGYLWLAFFTIAMSIISVYYYLVILRTILTGGNEEKAILKSPISLRFVMILSSAVTLFLGLYPGPVLEWTYKIASAFLNN